MRETEMHTGFRLENLKEQDHFEDLCVNGGIILKLDLKEMGWEGMYSIQLALERNKWWALVKTVLNYDFY
jgi:hypothetical protein